MGERCVLFQYIQDLENCIHDIKYSNAHARVVEAVIDLNELLITTPICICKESISLEVSIFYHRARAAVVLQDIMIDYQLPFENPMDTFEKNMKNIDLLQMSIETDLMWNRISLPFDLLTHIDRFLRPKEYISIGSEERMIRYDLLSKNNDEYLLEELNDLMQQELFVNRQYIESTIEKTRRLLSRFL